MTQQLRLFLLTFLFLGFTVGVVSTAQASSSDSNELAEVVLATPYAGYLDGDAIFTISKSGGLSYQNYANAERFLAKKPTKRNCLGYTVYSSEEQEITLPTHEDMVKFTFEEGTPLQLIFYLGAKTYESVKGTKKLPIPIGFSASTDEEVTEGTVSSIKTK